MAFRLVLMIVHTVLLVLASSEFTVITFFLDGHWQWNHYQYTRVSGWGLPYHSPYTLSVVLAYIAAYAAGTTVYAMICRKNGSRIGAFGMLACGIGLASFVTELTHWFSQWYGSWIVSLPTPLLALALLGSCLQFRRPAPASTPQNA